MHAYRAALETILIKQSKELRHSQVKNVKVTKPMTFEQLSFESEFSRFFYRVLELWLLNLSKCILLLC